jgi:hypothetical protein
LYEWKREWDAWVYVFVHFSDLASISVRKKY